MILCPKCSKENQDHYKFCLGCGTSLAREAAPKSTGLTPSMGMEAQAPARAPECPQCGHINQSMNVFCGSCGFRLSSSVSASQGASRANSDRPPASAHAAAAPQPAPRAIVANLQALRPDGSEAGTFPLYAGTNKIGREAGGVFAGDSYLSPEHALFDAAAGRVTVRDTGSLNGIYRKLKRDTPVEIRPGEVFRMGQEVLRFESITAPAPSHDGVERLGAPAKGYIGRIALVVGRETTGNAFPVPEAGLHLGRERGEVVFPEDGYVSGLHCHLSHEGGRTFLTDLGSSNGTFVRLHGEAALEPGDVLLMGQQLFRLGPAAS